jgi:ABC-type sugar transport system substrate-binding protein
MKRRVVGSLVAIAGLSGALMLSAPTAGAVSAHAAKSKKIVVGVSLAGYSTGFWAAYVQYESSFAKSDGLTLDGPVSSGGSAATQAQNIQTLINQHVNALLVNPVDSSAISTSDALAAKHHIPVVMMDVGPTSGHIYAVVRANNLLIGADAADYICKSAGGSATTTGTAVVLQGDLASINGLDRSNGFVNEMGNKCPEIHVVTYPTLWDSATAVSDATTALNAYSDLKGIYCSFSGPDDGIIAAIRSAGKSSSVPLVETDGVPAELALIRNGSLSATVSQPVNGYAEWGLYYAKQAVLGKKGPKIGSKGPGGGVIVNLHGSPEDALPSTFVTSSNVNDKALWGNTYTGP